jgi:HEPN domain-containing protein
MSSNLPQLWLNKANEDLTVARLVLEEKFFSHVCFLAQQSIEKALKGYLFAKTGAYPRTHGLVDGWANARSLTQPSASLRSTAPASTNIIPPRAIPMPYPALDRTPCRVRPKQKQLSLPLMRF